MKKTKRTLKKLSPFDIIVDPKATSLAKARWIKIKGDKMIYKKLTDKIGG